jgi:hypothetical protein
LEANVRDSAVWQAREGCIEEEEPGFGISQCFNGLMSLPMGAFEAIDILLWPAVRNLV